ncbi:MAG TPA: hypothetical protein VMM92_06000 [Thermoanaerobaculia bacterium]|nr:hypothetical protein [Thermoanaerobaculia bacterium]
MVALLGAVVLAAYGRALTRGWTSEDFLLLRLLRQDPPWHDLLAKLASPWLGLQIFKFYRPVSTLLFGMEEALFGTAPWGYNLVHILVHAGNACLVWAIARQIAGPDKRSAVFSLIAALLFAIYPLHPNAVIFAASFATIFATTFLLGAFLCHQLAGARQSWIWSSASLVLLALALGSYEAAAILPCLFIAHDLLFEPDQPLRVRAASWLPALLLLALYFLLRLHLFGVFLGGYEETGRRLLVPQLRQLSKDLAESLLRLHIPVFGSPVTLAVEVGFLGVVFLLPILYLGASAGRRRFLRGWLLAWIWMILALAPFAFRPVVPGNGRYWYLAAVGTALGVAFLAQAFWESWTAPWRFLPLLTVLALGGWWAVLLTGEVTVYIEAGRTAERIAAQLRETVNAPGGAPIFVAGCPAFLETPVGVPVAAVFHYGLSDAVEPPFAPGGAPVYPLPPLDAEELPPLINGRPGARIYEWEPGSEKLRQVLLAPSASPEEIEILDPVDHARMPPRALSVHFRPAAGKVFRLILLGRGNPTTFEFSPVLTADGLARADLPGSFVQAMDHLYGGDLYWWIEGRDETGRRLFSRMRSFRLLS